MATLSVQDGHLIVWRRREPTRWRLEDILWLEARGHHTRLHLRDGPHLVNAGLAAFVHWLPRHQFQRLNRSVVINRQHVRFISSGARGRKQCVLRDGRELGGGEPARAREGGA